MNEVISKRHPLNFYLTLLFAIIIYGGLGCVLPFIQKKKDPGFMLFIIIFSVLLILMGVYTIIRYYKNAPEIKISQKQIIFNTTIYGIEDIEHVQFTGKQPLPYLFTFYREGAEILFKNGDVKYIFDDMYSNAPAMKVLLENFFLNSKNPFEIQQKKQLRTRDISFEKFDYFKGNPLLNMRTFLLAFMSAMLLLILYASGKAPLMLILALFFGFISLNILLQFSYFGINNKHLIIKNHYLPWKQIIYKIEDIKEITFESEGNTPNTLRVTTKDYKSSKHFATTLTDTQWLNLKKEFESRLILVKNECIIDNNEL